MASIKRIHATFIYVSDMSVVKPFYQETLGLGKPIVETDLWVEFGLQGSHLALHQSDPRIRNELEPSKNTIKFCLEVDDIKSFCQDLKAKKVDIVFEPRKDFGSLLAEIKDPEGNLIRLIQFV